MLHNSENKNPELPVNDTLPYYKPKGVGTKQEVFQEPLAPYWLAT